MSDSPVIELDPAVFGDDSSCFGCAPSHPIGFRLRFERQGPLVRTRFVPHDRLQGPPGIMHGGLVLTLADEIAAWTVIGQKDRFGFTASVAASLKLPVRTGIEVIGTGQIQADSSRVLTVAVGLEQQGKQVFAGQFKFVLLDRKAAERLLGGPLPAAWERFARDGTDHGA